MTQNALTTLSSIEATRLTPPGIHSGMDITLQNVNQSGYIYVGALGVTPDNYGFRILPNHSFSVELNGKDSLYAIASAPDMKVAILKTSLEAGS